LDDISFDDPALTEPQAAQPPAALPPQAPPAEPEASGPSGPPAPVADATIAGLAYITVADASGRVLFRRPATGDEVEEALRSAAEAEREGQEEMERIASERFFEEALEDKPA